MFGVRFERRVVDELLEKWWVVGGLKIYFYIYGELLPATQLFSALIVDKEGWVQRLHAIIAFLLAEMTTRMLL